MTSSAQHRPSPSPEYAARETRGLVTNWGWRYDAAVWLFDTLVLRGRLRELHRQALAATRLQPGESVLDVGCGTGTLTLAARERVGAGGRVYGVDPGPRQIARARSRAARRGLSVDFQVGVIERLGFSDASFDVTLSSFMMHHLPDDLKRRGLAELARVLRPGGRLLIVDFQRPEGRPGRPARLGAGQLGIQDEPALMREAGFLQIETGDVRFPRFSMMPGAGFALGRKPNR